MSSAHDTSLVGMCVECGDQPADRVCMQCTDDFCEVCYASQHRKGKRQQHKWTALEVHTQEAEPDQVDVASGSHVSLGEEKRERAQGRMDVDSPAVDEQDPSWALQGGVCDWFGGAPSSFYFMQRVRYIPLRLSAKEREYLAIVEGCLRVSEYTDKIDVLSYSPQTRLIGKELTRVCSLLSGLLVVADHRFGTSMCKDKSFRDNAEFFQTVFEVARRHKIRNPEKMRDTYGKLIYLLMDSVRADVQKELGFSLMAPVKTVHTMLAETKQMTLCSDPFLVPATAQVVAKGKSRKEIDLHVLQKQTAVKELRRKYKTESFSEEDVQLVVNSINDNHSFLQSNRDPVEEMLNFLTDRFSKGKADRTRDLSIHAGRGGSKLSHSHKTQFSFVYQSLMLWREIIHNMFELWTMSEEDLTDEDNYSRLRNTGQGLQRMQRCPRVSRVMSRILGVVQKRMKGGWVGLSVVHLGDRDVPNALIFIDKYNQVARILSPIALVLNRIEALSHSSQDVAQYIRTNYGDVETAQDQILSDYFRHGFDGSGSDGGSCIDGRLTSSWNWCSKLNKKPYHTLFLLAGFVGFDGEF
jgi:hypothetical protein